MWRAYRSSSSALSMVRSNPHYRYLFYHAWLSWSGRCFLNHGAVVADQADVLNCALFNGHETSHEIDADGNIDVRGGGSVRPAIRAGADDRAIHGGRQGEARRAQSGPPRFSG